MAATEKSLTPNERNERLWRNSLDGGGGFDETADAFKQSRKTGFKSTHVNVNETERLISSVGGGALAVYGFSRGGWLGFGLATIGAGLLYRGVTGHCHMYEAAGINTAEKQNLTSVKSGAGVKIEKSVTINAPIEELYNFWRDFTNLPKFMYHLESVTEIDAMRSHWKAKAPLGFSVEWDAEIISEIPNELISWRSVEGSQINNAGSVRFLVSPSGRGTTLRVSLSYEPPAGKIGAAVAWLTGEEPSVQIREDLRRFKRLMETGEIPTIEGQPAGRSKSKTKYDRSDQ